MATQTADTVTVSLGALATSARARVDSGEYDSVDAVIREGLRALKREEAALDAFIKMKVEKALADPEPGLSTEEVFAELRAYHEKRVRDELQGHLETTGAP